jgi:hypothetical protein
MKGDIQNRLIQMESGAYFEKRPPKYLAYAKQFFKMEMEKWACSSRKYQIVNDIEVSGEKWYKYGDDPATESEQFNTLGAFHFTLVNVKSSAIFRVPSNRYIVLRYSGDLEATDFTGLDPQEHPFPADKDGYYPGMYDEELNWVAHFVLPFQRVIRARWRLEGEVVCLCQITNSLP